MKDELTVLEILVYRGKDKMLEFSRMGLSRRK
jgi:hypothetical protein